MRECCEESTVTAVVQGTWTCYSELRKLLGCPQDFIKQTQLPRTTRATYPINWMTDNLHTQVTVYMTTTKNTECGTYRQQTEQPQGKYLYSLTERASLSPDQPISVVSAPDQSTAKASKDSFYTQRNIWGSMAQEFRAVV